MEFLRKIELGTILVDSLLILFIYIFGYYKLIYIEKEIGEIYDSIGKVNNRFSELELLHEGIKNSLSKNVTKVNNLETEINELKKSLRLKDKILEKIINHLSEKCNLNITEINNILTKDKKKNKKKNTKDRSKKDTSELDRLLEDIKH